MRTLLLFLLTLLPMLGQQVPRTTPYGRGLIVTTNAPDAREYLGVMGTNALSYGANGWDFWMVGTNDYRARRGNNATAVSSNDFAGLLQYAYDNSAANQIYFRLDSTRTTEGFFRFTKTVELTNTAKSMVIEGTGNPTTLLVPEPTMTPGTPMFRVGHVSHSLVEHIISFKRLRFDAGAAGFGNVATNTITAIKFENVSEPNVADCEFNQFFHALDIATPTQTYWAGANNCWFIGPVNAAASDIYFSSDGSTLSEFRIHNCFFYLQSGHGIYISNSFDNITVSASRFFRAQSTPNAIKSTLGTNLVISANSFENFSTTTVPIRFDDRAAAQDVMASIVGNNLVGTSTNFVYIGTNVHGVTFGPNRHPIAGSPLVTAAGANTNGLVLDHRGSLIPVWTDVTTGDVSTSAHGLVPKATGVATDYLNAAGAYSTPAGGSGDNVFVDGSAATDPNFVDTADIDFTLTSTNVTGTVKTNAVTSAKIVDATITADDLGVDSVSASELDAPGVTNELAAILRLQDLQGAVVDGQVPNTITVDLATTATTANAGDSATAFFGVGTIEHERGGLEADVSGYTDGLYGMLSGATADIDTLAEIDTAIGITGVADATTFWRGDNAWAAPPAKVITNSLGLTIDGGGAAIATGVKGYLHVPYACTITTATLLAHESGSIVVDVWKDTYANYPPTVADTITASAKPTLSSQIKSQDTTLTGWTTNVSAGDVLGWKVDSASGVTNITLQLTTTR